MKAHAIKTYEIAAGSCIAFLTSWYFAGICTGVAVWVTYQQILSF